MSRRNSRLKNKKIFFLKSKKRHNKKVDSKLIADFVIALRREKKKKLTVSGREEEAIIQEPRNSLILRIPILSNAHEYHHSHNGVAAYACVFV